MEIDRTLKGWISRFILLLFLVSLLTTSDRASPAIPHQLTQTLQIALPNTSNYGEATIDGELSEWSSEELIAYPKDSGFTREKNITIKSKLAFNETHYFGFFEIEDDPLNSSFPFNANDTKIGDFLFFGFHDVLENTIHDGIVSTIILEDHELVFSEVWDEANFTSVPSVPGASQATVDLDYLNEDEWNATDLNSSIGWVNITYEGDNCKIWFAKSLGEFNISLAPGFPEILVEVSDRSFYYNGTHGPFNHTSGAATDWNPLHKRVEMSNKSSSSIPDIDWDTVNWTLNVSSYTKFYWGRTPREFRIGLRNNDEKVFVGLEVELPYVNQTNEVFGRNLEPFCATIAVEFYERVPDEVRTAQILFATIFNDNLTSVFAGLQNITSSLSSYPNNIHEGNWGHDQRFYTMHYPFAYTYSSLSSSGKYTIEMSTDLNALDIPAYGNGTHGEVIYFSASMRVNYFDQEDYTSLLTRAEEERACYSYYIQDCRPLSLLWEFQVASDWVNVEGTQNTPELFAWNPTVLLISTSLYPVQNITFSDDETQGTTNIFFEVVDEYPSSVELMYQIIEKTDEITIPLSPSISNGLLYSTEISGLKNGDEILYSIKVVDQFNVTTITPFVRYIFGTVNADSAPVYLLSIVGALAIIGFKFRLSRKKNH